MFLTGEDHAQRDQQQDHAACNGERLRRDLERVEQQLAREQEQHEQRERDQQLAHDHHALALRRHALQCGDEQRDVAERVHHEEQQDGRG